MSKLIGIIIVAIIMYLIMVNEHRGREIQRLKEELVDTQQDCRKMWGNDGA